MGARERRAIRRQSDDSDELFHLVDLCFSETLSDGLGIVTMDEHHDETRRKIRSVKSGASGDHLKAGIKGLGYGILGGMTSVVKQTYEGAANEGVQVSTRIGEGENASAVLKRVFRHCAGLLYRLWKRFGRNCDQTGRRYVGLGFGSGDRCTRLEQEVKISSHFQPCIVLVFYPRLVFSSSKMIPSRMRKPRCVIGPTGLLPTYSAEQSHGQELLYSLNHYDFNEV